MGKIFANRIAAGTWEWGRVPDAYKPATKTALNEKAEAGLLSAEVLEALIDAGVLDIDYLQTA